MDDITGILDFGGFKHNASIVYREESLKIKDYSVVLNLPTFYIS